MKGSVLSDESFLESPSPKNIIGESSPESGVMIKRTKMHILSKSKGKHKSFEKLSVLPANIN